MKVLNKFKRTLFVLIFATSFSLAYSQTIKQITISVQGVEYEDPRFTALRETLKKNPKVKSVKPAFSEGIATLTLNYSGEASELWDEVPKSSKQSFKLEEIDEDTISLTSITGNSKTTVAPATKNNSQSVKNNNCFDCVYFPLCKFDKTRSFKGELWKGIDDDGTVTYYHCENGELKAKIERFDNFEGNSIGFETFTVLKYNEPKGYSWNETVDLNGAKFYYTHTIVDKDISINVNGKTYQNVLKVYRKKEGASMFYQGKPVMTVLLASMNIYYAKNVGEIKTENVKVLSEEEKGIQREIENKNLEKQEKTNVSIKAHASMKGTIDNSLVGLWKTTFTGPTNRLVCEFIRFNPGGTVDYFGRTVDLERFTDYIQFKYDYKLDGNSFQKVLNDEWGNKKYPDAAKELYSIIKDTLIKMTESNSGKKIFKINGLTYTSIDPNNDVETGKNVITLDEIRNIWNGAYKLILVNDKPYTSSIDEYLKIQPMVSLAVVYHKTKDKIKPFNEYEPRCPGKISFTGDRTKYTIYITDCNGNTVEVGKQSAPKKILILGDKTYEYAPKVWYFQDKERSMID